MKNGFKITLALAAFGAAAILLCASRRATTRRMVAEVSNEGYETAQDILFPDRSIRGKKLHYGPVIPE
jgi:hypothetical protein